MEKAGKEKKGRKVGLAGRSRRRKQERGFEGGLT